MLTRNIQYNYITAYVAEAVFCGFSDYKEYHIFCNHGNLSIITNDKEIKFSSSDELISYIYQDISISA